ncbi:MAG: aquaporin [Bryobacterales bacterium]|nr:aquaporin [Bryobacterales bacterium]
MQSKAMVAEFIGTFALIFIGAGAAAVSGNLVAVALAHGLVVMAFAYAYGNVSGTHINPAVTIGLLAGGQIKLGAAIGYILVQLAGGIAGASVLSFVLGSQGGSLGATVPAEGIGTGQAFVLEVFLTFLLVNSIYHSAVSGKAGNLAPVAIGLTLTACIAMGGPLTGASLNPARSLGPALFSDAPTAMSSLWIYFVACPLGGVLAAGVHRFLTLKD